MRSILIFLLILIGTTVLAQKYTISGYVTDAGNGEKLIGANVYDANTFQGTVTNNYGFYSITLPEGKVKFTVSFVG